MPPCLLVLLLAAAPTAAPAPAPASAPVSAPAGAAATPEARAEQAAALYQQKKYLEAAQMLEALWAEVHEPRDLFNAGLARMALGHRAHAIRYWELYLQQPGIPDDGREQAQARLKKAQGSATGLIVRVAPSAVAELGASLVLVRVDDRGRPDLTWELPPHAPEFTSGGKTIYVDPGKWQLKVGARTYVSSVRDLNIKPGGSGFILEVPLANDPSYRHASFQIEPAGAIAAGATVTLQKLALNAAPVECPLDAAGKCGVRVEPGDWEVTVQAPGYQRHVEKITLGTQALSTFAVALAPTVAPEPAAAVEPVPAATPAPEPVAAPPEVPAEPAVPERVPKKVRIRLSAGLITAGIPVFITGLALAVHGSNVYDETKLDRMTNGELLPPIRLRSAGTALMGVAVGLWTTGLTAEYDVKPWVWWTELGIGGAALVAGSAWAAVTTTRWNADDTQSLFCNNNQGVDCFTAHRMGASFFLGFGASALAGAATGLLVQRKYPRTTPPRVGLSPTAGFGHGGLVLHGRF